MCELREESDTRIHFEEVKDSGAREQFPTGARRDTREGKGRYDLLPPFAIEEMAKILGREGIAEQTTVAHISDGIACVNRRIQVWPSDFSPLALASIYFLCAMECQVRGGRYGITLLGEGTTWNLAAIPPHGLHRVACHFEAGAKKYGDRNWTRGIPVSRYVDPAWRHARAFLAGEQDEDHLAAAAWNCMCALDTEHRILQGYLPEELNDLTPETMHLVPYKKPEVAP